MDWFLYDNELRHEGVKPKSYWFTLSALKNCRNHFMIINYSFFDSKIFLEIWRFVCQKTNQSFNGLKILIVDLLFFIKHVPKLLKLYRTIILFTKI